MIVAPSIAGVAAGIIMPMPQRERSTNSSDVVQDKMQSDALIAYGGNTGVDHKSEPILEEQNAKKGLRKSQQQKAVAYIHQHLNETIKLSDIAIALGISQYHFGRLFKQSMGVTVHVYLVQQRVAKAQQLLRETNLTILAISEQCGFANPSHLTKCFRKYIGLTPTQFREEE
jgi:transcriptional regulator GlxA family with amidase domain